MFKRKASVLQHGMWLCEAALVVAFGGLLKLLPMKAASSAGGWLGRNIGARLPFTRRAHDNLTAAFPGISETRKKAIIREMWDNLGRTAAESGHVRKLFPAKLAQKVREIGHVGLLDAAKAGEPLSLTADNIEISGMENFVRLLTHRGPALIFTPHMGNWELLPVGAARFGIYTSVVFRRPNNPYVARLLDRSRAGLVSLLPKGYAGALASAKVMQEGGRLGLLVDQKQNRGIPIPFFGRPAMTGVALARFALRFDAPVFGAWVRRVEGQSFVITITPEIPITKTGDDAVDERSIMTTVNGMIEDWVREFPEQWLWLHRRWPKE